MRWQIYETENTNIFCVDILPDGASDLGQSCSGHMRHLLSKREPNRKTPKGQTV